MTKKILTQLVIKSAFLFNCSSHSTWCLYLNPEIYSDIVTSKVTQVYSLSKAIPVWPQAAPMGACDEQQRLLKGEQELAQLCTKRLEDLEKELVKTQKELRELFKPCDCLFDSRNGSEWSYYGKYNRYEQSSFRKGNRWEIHGWCFACFIFPLFWLSLPCLLQEYCVSNCCREYEYKRLVDKIVKIHQAMEIIKQSLTVKLNVISVFNGLYLIADANFDREQAIIKLFTATSSKELSVNFKKLDSKTPLKQQLSGSTVDFAIFGAGNNKYVDYFKQAALNEKAAEEFKAAVVNNPN